MSAATPQRKVLERIIQVCEEERNEPEKERAKIVEVALVDPVAMNQILAPSRGWGRTSEAADAAVAAVHAANTRGRRFVEGAEELHHPHRPHRLQHGVGGSSCRGGAHVRSCNPMRPRSPLPSR